MLTGFAGYSGNRGVGGGGWRGVGQLWVVGTLWVVGYGGSGCGVGWGVVRFVYAEGGVRGCQLLDDSL